MRSVLETWFAEESGTEKPLMPWSKIGWFDEAATWMTNQLHRLGITAHSPVEQVKSFYTGGTLRVNTDVGYIYFKAIPHAFIREMEITQMLAQWFPTRIPVMLAADSERRWMLLRDIGGIDLSKISEIEVWEDVLRVYAQLQIDSLTFVGELLNGPFYDYQIQTMVSEIDSVIIDTPSLLQGYHESLDETELENLRSLSPKLKALCAEVENYGVPCTLEHGDFHDGNIRITKDGPVFYDWAWSCVTHPFLGPNGLLYKAAKFLPVISNARTRLRDAYLEAWTVYEPLNCLRELFNLIEQWKVLHAVLIDAEWVAAIQKELSHRVPLRYSFTEWALQKRQYYLARVLRRLFDLKLR
jgi:RIO-like serine/threonine protein kinase